MGINKQKFAILLGFLYSVAISADPIFHSFEIDHDELIELHESIECQVCENELFKAFEIQIIQGFALIKETNYSQEKRIKSNAPSGINARGPPNF